MELFTWNQSFFIRRDVPSIWPTIRKIRKLVAFCLAVLHIGLTSWTSRLTPVRHFWLCLTKFGKSMILCFQNRKDKLRKWRFNLRLCWQRKEDIFCSVWCGLFEICPWTNAQRIPVRLHAWVAILDSGIFGAGRNVFAAYGKSFEVRIWPVGSSHRFLSASFHFLWNWISLD